MAAIGREAPLRARNRGARRIDMVAHGHRGGWHGIGDEIRGLRAIAQARGGRFFIDFDFRSHQPGQPFNHGRIEMHHAGAIRNVELPADPDQRVALLEQQRIAEVLFGAQFAAVVEVEHAQHAPAAAIGDFEQRRAVPLRRILRPQHDQVGGELHQSFGVLRRAIDIRDDLVGGQFGIDGEIDFARDLLVVRDGKIHPLGDLDTCDGGVRKPASTAMAGMIRRSMEPILRERRCK